MSNLSDYFLDLSQLPLAQVQSIRQRCVDVLSAAWPELDTRPNSVAGDLLVTPDAILFAMAEQAMALMLSDLDLSNVAAGTIYNPTFVAAYLQNLGLSPLTAQASSGVMALTFSANQNYVIDANSQFTFGSSVFQINPGAGNPVVIYAVDSSQPSTGANPWVLTQTGPGQYTVYLPVTGPAGAAVTDGTAATYTLTIPQLIGIAATGNFDPGSQAETLPQMASRAQATFAAANLNTRSGALSFLAQRWPNMLAAYASVTTDPEMKRSGLNPLGIADGAMDVFIKSSAQYTSGNAVIPLTYDATAGGWVGALALPVTPAFFSLTSGVFQTSNFMNSRSLNLVYSMSTHPGVDDPSISFSKFEKLGIFIVDTNPQNFTQSSISNVVALTGNGVILQVSGEYASNYFNTSSSRAVLIRLVAATTYNVINNASSTGFTTVPAVQALVRDTLNGETGTVYFVSNGNPSGFSIVQGTYDYDRMLRGLNLTLTSPTGNFVPSDTVGANFSVGFSGRSASFNANYVYDPSLIQVDSVLQNPDNHPIGVDVVVRNFMPCYISQFTVNYRIGYGQQFDASTAQTQIAQYLNSISTPGTYEESRIGQIVLAAGASGLISVSKLGTFFPSLANYYIDAEGDRLNINKYPTNTLVPPNNDSGLSVNTVTYIVDPNTIAFNATVQ